MSTWAYIGWALIVLLHIIELGAIVFLYMAIGGAGSQIEKQRNVIIAIAKYVDEQFDVTNKTVGGIARFLVDLFKIEPVKPATDEEKKNLKN